MIEGTKPLLERLRDPNAWQQDELDHLQPLLVEAAAEIERLSLVVHGLSSFVDLDALREAALHTSGEDLQAALKEWEP